MKTLGLLRHAKSDWDDLATRDFDRGLNDRGRRGATLIGAHIRERGVTWDRLIASPAERVQRTLDCAVPELEPQFDRRLYLGAAETLMDVLRELDAGVGNVMVAAHNPGLQDMLFQLVSPTRENALFDEASVKFPTATFAMFELDIDSWAALEKECGALIHFARPRDLDPELGPES